MPGANNEQTGENNNQNQGTGSENSDNQESNQEAAGSAGDDSADFSDPAKAQAEIKRLRAENAKHRTKNKSLEERFSHMNETMGKMKQAMGLTDEEVNPEEVIQGLQLQNEAMQVQMAMSDLCREHDIPRSGESYFNFLIAKEFEGLAEGDEIAEDRIAELAMEAKKMFNGQNGGGSTGLNTRQKPAPGQNAGDISAAQFAKMNPGEKSALYVKNPNLYNQLFSEAKEKRLL